MSELDALADALGTKSRSDDSIQVYGPHGAITYGEDVIGYGHCGSMITTMPPGSSAWDLSMGQRGTDTLQATWAHLVGGDQ